MTVAFLESWREQHDKHEVACQHFLRCPKRIVLILLILHLMSYFEGLHCPVEDYRPCRQSPPAINSWEYTKKASGSRCQFISFFNPYVMRGLTRMIVICRPCLTQSTRKVATIFEHCVMNFLVALLHVERRPGNAINYQLCGKV